MDTSKAQNSSECTDLRPILIGGDGTEMVNRTRRFGNELIGIWFLTVQGTSSLQQTRPRIYHRFLQQVLPAGFPESAGKKGRLDARKLCGRLSRYVEGNHDELDPIRMAQVNVGFHRTKEAR